MTRDKSILIKNIYYMLSYAFQTLNQSNYEEIAAEKFEDMQSRIFLPQFWRRALVFS